MIVDSRNFDNDARIAAVVGCQGQGKSTLQRQLLREWPALVKVIFDHKRQFERLLPAFGCTNVSQLEAALDQTNSACFNPIPIYQENTEEAFAQFALWFWERQKRFNGRKLLTFDECGDLVPENAKEWKRHPLRKFTNTGREWSVDILTAAQAPTDVPLKFRNQVTDWYVFKLGDPGCVQPIEKLGFSWAMISQLQKGHYLHFNGRTGQMVRGVTRKDA